MLSTYLPIAEGCQGWSTVHKLLCKSMVTTPDHLFILHDFVRPFLDDFFYPLLRDWGLKSMSLKFPKAFFLLFLKT